MAERRKDRTERSAEWNASTRSGSAGARNGARAPEDDAPSPVGSHFEGDFGAVERPREAAGQDRDLESTDRDEATSREGYGDYRPQGGYGFGSSLPRRAEETPGEG